jgi:hypothetical protein
MLVPVVALARIVIVPGDLDEALVQAEVVPDRVLPALVSNLENIIFLSLMRLQIKLACSSLSGHCLAGLILPKPAQVLHSVYNTHKYRTSLIKLASIKHSSLMAQHIST